MSTFLSFVAFSVLPFFLMPGFPQQEEDAKGENLYSTALVASVMEMEKKWGSIDESNGGSRARTDYRNMLVERDPGITDGLPQQFGAYRFDYLEAREETAKFKKLRKEFPVLKIHPMKNEGAGLKIIISVYWVKVKNGKLNLGLSDWSEVEFRYDCEKKGFIVRSVNLGGI